MIKDYRNYLRIERRMSPNTVTSYCHDVEEFLKFVGYSPAAITSEDIERYLGHVTSDGPASECAPELF